jgi:NADH-quinone oxidoreductase subunit H
MLFIFAPIFTFGLAIAGWVVLPLGDGALLCDFRLSLVDVFMLSSLGVHTIIMAGWSSNSKYAFLGSLRSTAQMVSYEVSLGFIILTIAISCESFNINEIIFFQKNIWFVIPYFPLFVIFFIYRGIIVF